MEVVVLAETDRHLDEPPRSARVGILVENSGAGFRQHVLQSHAFQHDASQFGIYLRKDISRAQRFGMKHDSRPNRHAAPVQLNTPL